MKITPLQSLLLSKAIPLRQVRQALGVHRTLLWHWKKGKLFPNRLNVEKLIALYGVDRLDYEGCFVASVEVTEEQVRLYGLTVEVTA